MKITVISGSHRQASQSSKVANYVSARLQASGVDSSVFDLAGNPLPLWDESVWDDAPEWVERMTPIKALFQDSDGFVVVAPEWHGQAPAGLKNLFLLLSKKELGHKPALIVSVSNGSGGAYPVAELRMSSYKNNRICYLPEHMIIRDVENVLNEKIDENHPSDQFYRDRFDWVLAMLQEYARAFAMIRASDTVDVLSGEFGNGM